MRREQEISERHSRGPAATFTFAAAALAYIEAGGETRFLRPILEYFGPALRLDDLDNAALVRAAAAIYPHAAPATINRQLITPVSAIVTMAAEDGRAQYRKFRRLKGARARTRWLTPLEMDRFLDQAGAHLVPILAAMVGTGARVSEILAAEARYFYPDTGQIWLDATKNDWPRMLKMPGRARDLILAAAPPAGGALHRRPDGLAYQIDKRGASPLNSAFHRARDAAGLGADVTPHILRHTWATWFYAATKDYAGMLDLGGWRTPGMAERYRKTAPDDLAEDLLARGWDFTRLGRDIAPPAVAQPKRLRLVL